MKNLFLTLCVFLFFSNACFSIDPSQLILSLKSATLQLEQAEETYSAGKYQEASVIISRLRPLLSETTELHSQLYDALKEEAKAAVTANEEKQLTIEFAKLRDRANYLAGLISQKQGNYLEAAKHFVLVVQSQRTTELGKKAYDGLREMGFSPKLSIDNQI